MKRQSRKTKLYIFLGVLFLFFSLFLFLIFHPFNYKKEYKVDKYEIEESYNKLTGYYTFIIKDKDKIYPYLIKRNYSKKKEVISNILEYRNEDETCIYPEGGKIDFYPICHKDKEIYSYSLSAKEFKDYNLTKVKSLNKTYEQIKINYLNDKSYLIFNYRGFYFISNNENKKIDLFKQDIYKINLFYQTDDYLIIPDYNLEYYFDKFYLINMNNGKVSEIKLEEAISFDSVFLGEYKNKIYILDKKEEAEYALNINKKKITKTDFVILENNDLVKKTYREIVENNLLFTSNQYPNYQIQNSTLYLDVDKNLIKLSNKEIDSILKVDNDTVYYISNEDLYLYNHHLGEVLLLSNFEWNFNNTNVIFISK